MGVSSTSKPRNEFDDTLSPSVGNQADATDSSVEALLVSNRSIQGIHKLPQAHQVHPSMVKHQNYMNSDGGNEPLSMSERMEDRIRPSDAQGHNVVVPPKSLQANLLLPMSEQRVEAH